MALARLKVAPREAREAPQWEAFWEEARAVSIEDSIGTQ
jgi:hypothetical protein